MMGQGSQSGIGGTHPAWEQMAHVGGGMSLPDPMQRARQHFLNARGQFMPIRDEFQSLEGAERRAMRPEMQEARQQFQPVRDWWRDLRGMPEGEAIGTAAMGPPRNWSGPELAPTMAVPQFPGMAHDGTIAGLLDILQQQTANQTFGGGRSGGGLGPSSEFPQDQRLLTNEQREQMRRERHMDEIMRERERTQFHGKGR